MCIHKLSILHKLELKRIQLRYNNQIFSKDEKRWFMKQFEQVFPKHFITMFSCTDDNVILMAMQISSFLLLESILTMA